MARPVPSIGTRPNYALYLLLGAYILSFVDRQILSLMVGPIRNAFGISDFEFSLLHGLAFALFYTIMGLPIGRLVDRCSRRNIVAVGVFFWSVMTCLCGMAQNFLQLFLSRMGVGVGEASLSPAAYSLISDFFEPEKLGRALAVYSMGITLGGGIAFMVGGWVYEFFNQRDAIVIPIVGALAPWQSTFVTVGVPGFLMTLLLLTIREPTRRGVALEPGTVLESIPVREVVGYLRQHWRAYAAVMLGISLMSVIGYGSLAWYPEFLHRSYGMDKAASGSQFGLLFMITGTLGTLMGARLCEMLRQRGHADAELRLIMLLAIACSVPAVVAPLMSSPSLALLCAAPVLFFHYAHFAVGIAALQLITPNQMRGQVSALMLFLSNLLGMALGGSLIAFCTDFLFRSEAALNEAISLVSALVYPLVALVVWSGLRQYRWMLAQRGQD